MKPLVLAIVALAAAPAAAQSLVPGPSQPGRYEMQPIDGGVARLDTVTGDVSLCRVENETLRCRPSEDDAAAAANDNDNDNDGADDGDDRAEARRAAPDRDAPKDTVTDAEIDKALARLKRTFRAFNDIARDFEADRDSRDPSRT